MPASRRRRALLGAAAAVPAVLVAQAPPEVAAAAPSPEPPSEPAAGDEFCSTTVLTPEEVEQGRTSTITCYPTFEQSLRSAGATPLTEVRAVTMSDAELNAAGIVALHHDSAIGGGQVLTITGWSCDGGGVVFEAGSTWNDRIRRTSPRGCSAIKHWTEPNYVGTSELVSGTPANLSSALAGRVSSMRYW